MTTTHAFDREEVMAYLDGELAEPRAAAVRAHLEACAECREMAAGFGRVAAQLGAWHVETSPERVRAALVSAATRSSTAGQPGIAAGLVRWLTWPRWAIVAAPVMVLILGISLTRGRWPAGTEGSAELPAIDRRSVEPAAPSSGYRTVGKPVEDQMGQPQALPAPALPGTPMVIRTATLRLTTDRFDEMRAAIERLAAGHAGRIASLSIGGEPNRRSLHATLRVPSVRLDAALVTVRQLGRVQNESIGTEDVTSGYQDLNIRVANAKREEKRLVELLSQRTGKLAEVLEVEQAIARVRTEIERMEAALRSMKDQVDLSTVNLEVNENYRAEVALGPVSLAARMRNAAVDGTQAAAASVFAVVLAVVQIAPVLLLWALLLAWPVRWILRRAKGRGPRTEDRGLTTLG